MKLNELQKNKKLIIAVLSAAAVVAIILNLRTFGISMVSEKMITGRQAEVKTLEIKLKNIEAEYKFEEDKIWNLNALLRNFWQPKFDGDGMETFKPLIEKLAKESKITFSFIGNVRRNGGTGLVSYNLPISGSAPFSVLLPFMMKIDKNCPHISWQSLTLSLNRGNSTQIDFNGSVRVFCLENPAMIELLEKVTKPKKPAKITKSESGDSKPKLKAGSTTQLKTIKLMPGAKTHSSSPENKNKAGTSANAPVVPAQIPAKAISTVNSQPQEVPVAPAPIPAKAISTQANGAEK